MMLGRFEVINGDRIRQLRESKGYSREKFAESIGIGTTQAYKYEMGKSDATGEVIARMSRFFDVSSDYLLGLSDSPDRYEKEFTEAEMKIINAILNNKLKEVAQAILDLNTSSV